MAHRLCRPLPAVIGALLFFAGVSTVLGQAPLAGSFESTSDYLVSVDGKSAAKAEVFISKRARSVLLLLPELQLPVLVDMGSQRVSSLDLMRVAKKADGTVDLFPGPPVADEGPYTVAGDEITLRAQGRAVKLAPRPWLLGQRSGAELLAHSPDYGRKATAYTPIGDLVSRLKAVKVDVRVLAFFGSWCPHCKENLPHLLKVAEKVANPKLRFDYYGLPQPFDKEPEALKWNVVGVPMAIVFVGGKEVGRITASQMRSPEAALYDILKENGGI